ILGVEPPAQPAPVGSGASAPVASAKPNQAGPVSNVQLSYNFQPDMNYLYDFELESGHDENGPMHAKGSITYTGIPNMRQQPATVSADRAKRKAGGSAFVVNQNGVLVTCAHVVADATKIELLLDGKNYPAKVLHVDSENDLAVIQIDGRNL